MILMAKHRLKSRLRVPIYITLISHVKVKVQGHVPQRISQHRNPHLWSNVGPDVLKLVFVVFPGTMAHGNSLRDSLYNCCRALCILSGRFSDNTVIAEKIWMGELVKNIERRARGSNERGRRTRRATYAIDK